MKPNYYNMHQHIITSHPIMTNFNKIPPHSSKRTKMAQIDPNYFQKTYFGNQIKSNLEGLHSHETKLQQHTSTYHHISPHYDQFQYTSKIQIKTHKIALTTHKYNYTQIPLHNNTSRM